jgi:hypothetical protein
MLWQEFQYKCGGWLNRTIPIDSSSAILSSVLVGWSSAHCQGVTVLFTLAGAHFTLSREYRLTAANITLDASRLASPVTIFASSLSRHFTLAGSATLAASNVIFAAVRPASATPMFQGGSMFISGPSVSVLLTRCGFVDNFIRTTASLADHAQGGALYIAAGEVTLRSCTFRGNSVYAGGSAYTGLGGAVCHAGGGLVMTSCTWLGNSASGLGGTGYGGGLYSLGVSAAPGANFTRNSASTSGGGVYLGSGARLALTDAVMRFNRGGASGGALFLDSASILTLARTVFESNQNLLTPQDDVFNRGTIQDCSGVSRLVQESSGVTACTGNVSYCEDDVDDHMVMVACLSRWWWCL